jgi:hypothetical protein
MEIFKEYIIQIIVLVPSDIKLVISVRYVTHFIQVLWSDLTDVQINKIGIICIYLEEFFFIEIFCVNPSLNMDLLMR